MKKKALRKDFYMEIRKSYNRFLSIFLIVALGVAFFSGIRAAKPDMELSADLFYDENNYMDIRVLSTLGLTEEDVEALEAVDGVETVVPGYSTDVLSFREDGMYTLKVFSASTKLNEITPVEGRLPETSGECILDSGLEQYGYQIGDTITIESGTEDDITDSFKTTEYIVVGMGITPNYLSLERETSRIGRGYVDGFMAVLEEDFNLEAYTEIYLSVEGAKELVSYRTDYQNLVDETIDRIEAIQAEREEARYQSIKTDAELEIADAKQELIDGKAEAEKKLADAYQELTDGKAELEEKEKELSDAKQELLDGQKKLSAAEKEIAAGEKKLSTGEKEYEDGKAELLENEKKLKESKTLLSDSKALLETKKAELSKGKEELSTQKKTLEAQKTALEQQEAEFLAAKEAGLLDEETLAATEQQLAAGKQALSEGEAELSKAEATLAAGEKEIAAKEAEISAGEKEIATGEKELAAAKKKLSKAEKTLAASRAELLDGKKQLAKSKKELATAEQDILEGEEKLAEAKVELADGEKEYEEEKAKAEREIANGELEIAEAEETLSELEKPEWYIFGREYSQAYAEFGENAERIGAIGEVFPVFFFLIAALVCLTTMTRMVEEERTQIGTLKALGYSRLSIAAKYLLYAGLASLFGGIVGALIGQKVLPLVIVDAYRMMYVNLPYCLLPYNIWYSVSSIGVVMACTVLAAFFACLKELRTNAAELMRPEAPKAGKRVLLERLGFLWKRLSFGQKASVRNLFRYKKRFFMTIIGIGGCMALLLVGFGIRDSIFDIARFQYEELFVYSGMIVENEEATKEETSEMFTYLDENTNIEKYLSVCQISVDLEAEGVTKSAYLVCPETTEDFASYVVLRDRKTKEEYTLTKDTQGIILTEKIAQMLGVEAGDEITIKLDDTTRVETRIACLTENYSQHYLYMTPGLYKELFEERPDFNLLYYVAKDDSQTAEDTFANEILTYEAAGEIRFNSQTKKTIEDMLGSLDIVVYVLIISAGLLAFVVLYNLNNININERQRELATLRVLGFYNGEVGAYVYRESIMLTVIGIVVGAFLGIALHHYVVITAEIDLLMFGRTIRAKSYVLSGALTALFSALVNWVMYFRLKKIDMVEALKSIE